jgi:hypothetical protein
LTYAPATLPMYLTIHKHTPKTLTIDDERFFILALRFSPEDCNYFMRD